MERQELEYRIMQEERQRMRAIRGCFFSLLVMLAIVGITVTTVVLINRAHEKFSNRTDNVIRDPERGMPGDLDRGEQ